MAPAESYGSFSERGRVGDHERGLEDDGEEPIKLYFIDKAFLVSGTAIILGTILLGLSYSPTPMGLRTPQTLSITREDYVRAKTYVSEIESSWGCCYAFGYGAMMKPCCLEILSKNAKSSTCNSEMRLGGQTNWVEGRCPASPEEAKRWSEKKWKSTSQDIDAR